jgi:hypothetical protein
MGYSLGSCPNPQNIRYHKGESLIQTFVTALRESYVSFERRGIFVKSLTSFFTVPKGDDDIRIVYNGTQSGLNE